MPLHCAATKPNFLNVYIFFFFKPCGWPTCLDDILENGTWQCFMFFCFTPSPLYLALWCRLVCLLTSVSVICPEFWLTFGEDLWYHLPPTYFFSLCPHITLYFLRFTTAYVRHRAKNISSPIVDPQLRHRHHQTHCSHNGLSYLSKIGCVRFEICSSRPLRLGHPLPVVLDG